MINVYYTIEVLIDNNTVILESKTIPEPYEGFYFLNLSDKTIIKVPIGEIVEIKKHQSIFNLGSNYKYNP